MHEWELREKQKRFRLEDSIMRRLQKDGVYVSERGGLIVTDAGMAAEVRGRDRVIAEQTKEVTRMKVVTDACIEENKLVEKRSRDLEEREGTMHEWELREKQKRFRLEDSIMRRLDKEGVYVSERGGLIVTDAHMTAETRARDELIEEKINEVNRIKLVSERIASKWRNEKSKAAELARHAEGLEMALRNVHREGRMLGRLAESELKKAQQAAASLCTLRMTSKKDIACLRQLRHARRMVKQSQRHVATSGSLPEGGGYKNHLLSFTHSQICNYIYLHSRRTTTGTAEIIQRLESRVAFLEEKCDGLEDREAELSQLVRELTSTVEMMKAKFVNPPPLIHFGEPGEEWEYDVAEIAYQLFSKRFNASMVSSAFEVFLGALYPGQNVRVPSVKMAELWRWSMHSLSRFVVLKCFEHAELLHGVTDESRKGGASILASGLRGEFERAGETHVVDALIQLDFIANQDATTERDSFINALAISLGDDPELQANVSLLKVRSMASDHASGAQKTSALVGEAKLQLHASLTDIHKSALSIKGAELALAFDCTTCQNHLLNLLTTAWVGKACARNGDPDKAIAAHGKHESKVQFCIIAAAVISTHIDIAEGRRCLHTFCGKNSLPRAAQIVLLKYAFQKMHWKWHSCRKNVDPKPYTADDVCAISEVLYAAAKLFGHTGDFASYYLNEGRILKAWGRTNRCEQKAMWKAFKSSRMNWNVECAAVLLQNAETCLPFLHQLRVCTKKPNKLVMKVWYGLSCRFTMAAFAARTIFFLEIINPIR